MFKKKKRMVACFGRASLVVPKFYEFVYLVIGICMYFTLITKS